MTSAHGTMLQIELGGVINIESIDFPGRHTGLDVICHKLVNLLGLLCCQTEHIYFPRSL